MKKLLVYLMIFAFLATSACAATNDRFPEEDADKTISTENEKDADVSDTKNEAGETYYDENEIGEETEIKNETEPSIVAYTPDCPTCGPYIHGDKMIILNDGEITINGIENINFPTTGVNCFVYDQRTRLVFADSGVYAFPDCEYTHIIFTDSGMETVTESIENSDLFKALSDINSNDKIVHVSPQIFYGDTMELPGIYVFTESGKCVFTDENGTVMDCPNISFIIDENGHTVTLYKDETVSDSYFDDETSSWTDVCFIDTNRTDGYGITAGVGNDGKVLIAGEYKGDKAEIEEWTDAVSVVVINDMENYYPIALTRFGALFIPSDSGCKFAETVSEWSNIVEIGLTAPDGAFWAKTADGDILLAE